MAIAYIIFSSTNKKFYTGSSRVNDLTMRIAAHNAGRVRSTKSGRPWTKVMEEVFDDYTHARKRELFLKSGVGRQWTREKFGRFKQS